MTTRKKKIWLVLFGLYALGYLGSYALLSARGSYVELVCGASDGSEHWYPLGCDNRRPSLSGRIKTKYPSPLGVFFLPLLVVDQRFIHPSKPGIWDLRKNERESEGRSDASPDTALSIGEARADSERAEAVR
jgi:hypothetical protein